FAGRPMLALNPMLAEKGMLDDLLRRAQREALLRGAVLYVGGIGPELLTDQGRELAKRISDYPSAMVLGVDGLSPPRLRRDHPIQEIQFPQPSEPTRLTLWQRFLPKEACAENVDLVSIARGFIISPGEINESAVEVLTIARADKNRKVQHEDVRASVDRRLRNELGDMA